VTSEEREYLIRHLASEADWDRLWRLIRDLPLADAVESMRHFDDEWQPDSDADAALLGRLARAEPVEIARARDALDVPEVIRIEIDDQPTHGAFSPDGRRLLVATSRGGRYSGCRVYELPGGTLAEQHDYGGGLPPAGVLHLGDCYVLVGRRRWGGSPQWREPPSAVWELVRYAGGRADVPFWSEHPVAVVPQPGGFVVVEAQQSLRVVRSRSPGASTLLTWGPVAELTGIRLQFRDLLGNVTRTGAVSGELGLGFYPARLEPPLAADPDGLRLAIGAQGLAVLDLQASRVVAGVPARRARPSLHRMIDGACFPGPDRLATIDRSGRLRLYLLTGDRLQFRARAKVSGAFPRGLVTVPQRGEIAVIDEKRGLRYLDAETLADVEQPPELAGLRGSMLCGSSDGRHHALGGSRGDAGFVDVHWGGPTAVAALARRPVAVMAPADLAALMARLPELLPGAGAWPFLDLLRECLEHRFAADAGIDPATGLSKTDHDAALSARHERPC
jgi:hypothetical protein